MNEPDRALAALIDRCEPEAVATLGNRGQTLAEHWCEHHPGCRLTRLDPEAARTGLLLDRTQDLALLTDGLEQLPHAQGQTLIGQLRNYGTRQIAVMVSDAGDWSLSDFIGLGFKRQAHFEEEKLTLYTYNIDSYNHKRTWNNPKYWANPEMWDKARW